MKFALLQINKIKLDAPYILTNWRYKDVKNTIIMFTGDTTHAKTWKTLAGIKRHVAREKAAGTVFEYAILRVKE